MPDEVVAEMLSCSRSSCVVADAVLNPLQLGVFVVAIRTRSRFRTLHRIGSCYRRPGLHYLEYRAFMDMPAAANFDATCKLCFAQSVVDESDASTGSSSSEDAP